MAQTELERTEVERRSLARRLDAIAWGLFFIMLGGILLLPNTAVPHGTWLLGAGLIMLGLNVARQVNGIRTSSFSIGLGVVAVVAGVAAFAGLDLPVLPLILILIGAEILFNVLRSRDR